MRKHYATMAALAVGGVLLGVCAVFAWVRSAGIG